MNYTEKWIWLDPERYPESQATVYSGFCEHSDKDYCVAEFMRKFSFDKPIRKLFLRFSADTAFTLYLNGELLGTGPVSTGGDYMFNDFPRRTHYASLLELTDLGQSLDFYALVKLLPLALNEYSQGRGGFMLFGRIEFEDNTESFISTDEDWLCRRALEYVAPYRFDMRANRDRFCKAREVQNIWHCTDAPIPLRTEKRHSPCNRPSITVAPHEELEEYIEFDRIYSAFIALRVETEGELCLNLVCSELDEEGSAEDFVFTEKCEYRSIQLHSIGAYKARIKNNSDAKAVIEFALIETHYPVYKTATTRTSDEELNLVLEVCTHTLKQCRQMIHLDSPRHSEPLACTGDYYIESLMTAFSFGDMSLAEFDLRRTAELLCYHKGRMFHTSYSLIFVQMLYDVYLFTGNIDLLYDCYEGLCLLCERFDGYIGENGIIENPPDYMFVDWIYIDGISLHHPPKALGQTCLNIFYFGMLNTAEKIFTLLSRQQMASLCRKRADSLKLSVNSLLYDSERGLYFEGLNTPTDESLLYHYMPQNIDRRYYLSHSNILAAYFGICSKEKSIELIREVMSSRLGECQPYFLHYLLEAVYRCGLREEFTMEILSKWKKPTLACPKGLVEGFISPGPDYSFDHSHAWGGTPAYSLPKALLGIEIVEPAYRKIRLSPTLLGLDFARVEVPTAQGMLVVEQKKGRPPVISLPEGVELLS